MKKLEDYLYYEEKNPSIKIYHGDCLELIPKLPKVGLVVTDPPYGINLKYEDYDDTEENWDKLFLELIPKLKAVSKMSILPSCRIAKLPFIFKHHPPDWLICWYKGSPGHRAFVGFNDWEPHLVYGKNDKVVMHDYFYAQPDNNDVFYKEHPCPKSPRWAKWLISNALGDGKVVLDPFLGSGTTLVACKELNVDGIGIEMSKKYCEIAKTRVRGITPSLF